MTIKQAFEKAIEGGWNIQELVKQPVFQYSIDEIPFIKGCGIIRVQCGNDPSRYLVNGEIFMDKNFWKCLGESLRWDNWLGYWHKFVDCLAGEDNEDLAIIQFFSNL